jgi:hypothetical protein
MLPHPWVVPVWDLLCSWSYWVTPNRLDRLVHLYNHPQQLAGQHIAKIVAWAMQHLSLLSSLSVMPYMTCRETIHSPIMARAYISHAAFSHVHWFFSLVLVEERRTAALVGFSFVHTSLWYHSRKHPNLFCRCHWFLFGLLIRQLLRRGLCLTTAFLLHQGLHRVRDFHLCLCGIGGRGGGDRLGGDGDGDVAVPWIA